MPLSVSITSVSLAGALGVRVAGAGSPNGASVAVQVQINGGGNGNGMTLVNNGLWSTVVAMQAVAGQTGTATATITDPVHFPGQSAQAQMNFTL
jgi:hypothetical protein